MAMTRSDFLRIAEYGNENWKGSFTPEEVSENAELYYTEYNVSNEQGKATHAMEELCKLLIDDIEGGSDEAYDFLEDIMLSAEWRVEAYHCDTCNKREIVFSPKKN